MAYQFTMPGRTLLCQGALEASEETMKTLGKKALIVTGKHVVSSGPVQRLTQVLDKWNIAYEIFSEITGEPTDTMIEMGVRTYFTIITDTKKDVKMLLKGEALLSQLAIVDASFTMTAPKNVTVATGMDALTHAVESYTSRKRNEFTDMFALSAIKRIFTYLPIAYRDGSNQKAREEMALAAFEAGVCINNASVTLVHGMSRPIGALFHVPHGISNAMLLKECLTFALDGCYDRFGKIARELKRSDHMATDKEAAEAFLKAIEELCDKLEIPTLEEYGIDRKRFESLIDKMADDAMNSGSPSNTIKQITKEDIIAIYKKLYNI